MEHGDLKTTSNSSKASDQSHADERKNLRKSQRLSLPPLKLLCEKKPKAVSTTKEPANHWKLGDYCEACDQTKNWYKCKIIQLEEARVKIHFCGWNIRYDKWLDKNSNELRPEKKAQHPKSKPVDATESDDAKSHVRIENGSLVMGKWIDEAFYPAKIVRYLTKNDMPYYEVKFYDGIRKTVRFSNLRLPTDDEVLLFDKPEAKTEPEKEETPKEEPQVDEAKKSDEEDKRRAEAELLLAIQEPVLKVNDQSPKNEEPPVETKEVEEQMEVSDKVEPEQKEEKMEEEVKPEEKVEEVDKPEEEKKPELKTPENNIRKSLRVKRLRTFREEIVFDSPASSISYNLASMRKEKTPEPVAEAVVKRKKVEEKPSVEEKEENRKKVQNYFKSLKLFKSNKKVKMDNKETEMRVDDEEEERRKRKKMKKDKRKLFEEIIRNSKIQLERNQQLIAKQLEEHNLKKSQKKLQKMLKRQQKEQEMLSSDQSVNSPFVSEQAGEQNESISGPICCTFENCTKTFRKQSLLDYHLKYHHYADSTGPRPELAKPKRPAKNRKAKLEDDEEEGYTYGHSLKSDDETDPYEVIHCKCGNNVNKGFMIQCEICLCWQHGECESIRSNKQVPANYLCWVCSEPANNLKNLKYQNWMNTRMQNELKLKQSGEMDVDEIKRLKLLNECSKQYYGLNLLMYTLEFQMSLFNQLTTKSRPDADQMDQSVDNNNNEMEYDDETYDQLDRLSQNIAHLQACLSKQFEEFNSKLEEYESTYPMDENLELQNFDLEQLYNQLQSIL